MWSCWVVACWFACNGMLFFWSYQEVTLVLAASNIWSLLRCYVSPKLNYLYCCPLHLLWPCWYKLFWSMRKLAILDRYLVDVECCKFNSFLCFTGDLLFLVSNKFLLMVSSDYSCDLQNPWFNLLVIFWTHTLCLHLMCCFVNGISS